MLTERGVALVCFPTRALRAAFQSLLLLLSFLIYSFSSYDVFLSNTSLPKKN